MVETNTISKNRCRFSSYEPGLIRVARLTAMGVYSHPDNIVVELSRDLVDELLLKVDPIIAAKRKEDHHNKDGSHENTRWTNGKLGEAAFAQHFRLGDVVDWTVGDSERYDVSDLIPIGLEVGIKTVLKDNGYHITHIVPDRPEILIFAENLYRYLIVGFVSMGALRDNQDPSGVKSVGIVNAGIKTAFSGYHLLKRFKTIDELRMLAAEDEARERSPSEERVLTCSA